MRFLFLFLLLSSVSLFAQRTPLKVNGTIVNNPNLTNSATVTYTVNGANVTATAAGSGGGTVGTVINTGASGVGNVPAYTDATGTNVAPFTALTLSGTNASLAGVLTANGGNLTNNLRIGAASATSGSYINLGTNAPSGYLIKSPSQSGSTTNLGFNWTHSATYFDAGLPPDEVSMWGYNITPGGARASTSDTAIAFTLEGSYNSGANYTEAHLQYVDSSGVQHRPFSWRINKNNASDVVNSYWVYDFQLQNSASALNPIFFQVTPTGLVWRSTNANAASRSIQWSDDGFNVTLTRMPGTASQGDFLAGTSQGWRNWNIPNAQFGSSHTLTAGVAITGDNILSLSDATPLTKVRIRPANGITLASDRPLMFSATTTAGATGDSGIARDAAGVVRVTDGSTGSGSMKVGLIQTPTAAGTIASASTIAPTARITFVSGTTTIDTITAPSPVSSTGGQITLIPTDVWATSTSGNVALATTAVVSKALILTYDQATAKWYPSY